MLDAEFWVAIAFVVFLGVLYRMGAFSALINSLDQRSAAIRKELEEAKALKEEAQRIFLEYKKKFDSAEAEADAIIARARAEAERHAAEVEAEFASFMERRKAMAEKRIAMAEANAMTEVRNAAADAAVKASEIILSRTLTGDTAEKLIVDSVTDIRSKLS